MAKRPTDIVKLQLRLTELLRSRLEREADKANRSMNAEIIERLEQSLNSTVPDRVQSLIDKAVSTALSPDRLQTIWSQRDRDGAPDKGKEESSSSSAVPQPVPNPRKAR